MFKKILMLSLVFINLAIYAKTDSPVDLIIAFDKSNSMREEINAVKAYINDEIITNMVFGSNLIVIPFYGITTSGEIINMQINSDKDKRFVKEKINNLFANGDFTDIGNALDTLEKEIAEIQSSSNRRTLMIMTDGKHEPPPFTRYPSAKSYKNHAFLKESKEKTMGQGWKIIYLDIGGNSDPELVEEISTTHYVKIDTNPDSLNKNSQNAVKHSNSQDDHDSNLNKMTDKQIFDQQLKEEITEKTTQFDAFVDVTGDVLIKPVNQKGMSQITIHLITSHISAHEKLTINDLGLETLSNYEIDLVQSPFTASLPEEGEVELKIPVLFSGNLTPGNYSDSLIFQFDEKEHFNRKQDVTFRINTFFQNYTLILIVAILLALGLLAGAGYFVYSNFGKSKIKFRLVVEELSAANGKIFRLLQGKMLYLNEEKGDIFIDKKRSMASVVRLSVIGRRLKLTALNKDKVPSWKSIPQDSLGYSFPLISDRGQEFHVKFEKI